MTSLITCSISYSGENVLCFDPEKVLMRLAVEYPDLDIDWTDLAAVEVQRIHDFTDSHSDMSPEHKQTMRRQIAGKQRRNGPGFRFRISDNISGIVSRYSLSFQTDRQFADSQAGQIRAFMISLGAGTVAEFQSD